MTIDNKFDISSIVYVKTDKDQSPRIVISILVYKCELKYGLATNSSVDYFYDFEISDIKNSLEMRNTTVVGFSHKK